MSLREKFEDITKYALPLCVMGAISVVGAIRYIHSLQESAVRDAISSVVVNMEDRNGDGLDDIIVNNNRSNEAVFYAYRDNITEGISYSRHREIEH